MKPGLPKWAENNVFAAGTDPGFDTKEAPSAGQEGEGYYREFQPAAQVWNYNNWASMTLARNAAAIRSLNYLKTNSVGPDASTGGGAFVRPVYDPLTRNWFTVLNNGGGANSDELGFSWVAYLTAGLKNAWETSTLTTPGVNGRQPNDFAIDAILGNRAYVSNITNRAWYSASGAFAVGGTNYATAFGASGAGSNTLINVEHNWLSGGSALWVLAQVDAGVYTLRQSATVTTAHAVVTVDPGFGADAIQEVRHSHHEANKNYYGDTGNSIWMALATTNYSTSSDGLTWTSASAHGVPSPQGLGYSAYGSRWVTIEGTANNARIHYSDDNGVTWTAGQVLSTALAALTSASVVSDDAGHWVATIYDSATPDNDIFVSVDNGVTWTEPQLPSEFPLSTTPSPVIASYGGGKFWIFTDDGSGIGGTPNYGIYSSLIGGDL